MNKRHIRIIAFFTALFVFVFLFVNLTSAATTFVENGLPLGTSWNVTITGASTSTCSSGCILNSTSNIITANLPDPSPGLYTFTLQPLNPEVRGVIYLSTSEGLLTWNAANPISYTTLFNFNTFYANLANSLKASGINITLSNNGVIEPLSATSISSIYNQFGGLSVGTNPALDEILIQNQTQSQSYGGLRNITSSKYIAANSNIKYAVFNNQTETLSFYNTTIAKNPSYICINLTSSLFAQNICQPGTYHLPISIIRGHFGINGPTSLQITAKLQSNLIGAQTASYSALIKTGNSVLVQWSNNVTNAISVTKTFTYSVGQALNITLDGGGNNNYTQEDPSITPPTNIIYYLPVNVINYQNKALAQNTPIAVGVSNTIASLPFNGIIGFNALAYSQYYTCNLNNAEWFYTNGTIIPSWLEGNIINEYTANTACTSSSSTNALVNSANVVYWLLIGGSGGPNANNFLPANTGAFTYNTVYLGWAGNVISAANNLLSNTLIGEAPQLSCNTPQNTITGCTAGQYAQYDTGNVVFGANGVYDNFLRKYIKFVMGKCWRNYRNCQ